MLFGGGSDQDPDNSEQVIASLDQGGLGLPDRDYYTKDDAKSKETRERYVQHVQKVFELLGDNPETAKNNAQTVMRMETALAKASLTRVERRDPYKLKNKMDLPALEKLAPNFDWQTYYSQLQYPKIAILNVTAPAFFKQVNAATRLASHWKTGKPICGSTSPIRPRHIFPRISSRKTSTSIASICAARKKCSRAGSAACNTPTAIWAKPSARPTFARFFRRS